jgi:nitronate monooxygenase
VSRASRGRFLAHAGIEVPVIGGAMYPCSNPELVAAVSRAGGIGIVQPLTLTYVLGLELREGLRLIGRLAGGRPVGMNALIESSSRAYHDRMVRWVETALEERIRFFVTSLGKPRWVAERVHAAGGVVYHDVTERRWAQRALASGVDGLIAVNSRAGGHAGPRTAEELLGELADVEVPIICAGGVATAADVVRALELGYAGVQMGTRLIATPECHVSEAYKQAIVRAEADDIVLSERVTGVPLAVIRTPYVERMGLRAGPLARWMLRGRRRKRLMRTLYALRSGWTLARSSRGIRGAPAFWQAGRSVAGVDGVEPVADIVHRCAAATRDAGLI